MTSRTGVPWIRIDYNGKFETQSIKIDYNGF